MPESNGEQGLCSLEGVMGEDGNRRPGQTASLQPEKLQQLYRVLHDLRQRRSGLKKDANCCWAMLFLVPVSEKDC